MLSRRRTLPTTLLTIAWIAASLAASPRPGAAQSDPDFGDGRRPPALAAGAVQLTKTALRRRADPGAILVYAIEVRNIGVGTLTGLELVDRLPDGFTLVRGRATRDGSPSGDPRGRTTLTWSLGSLAANAVTRLTYEVVVAVDARRGLHENIARVVGFDGLQRQVEAEARAVVAIGVGDLEEVGSITVSVHLDADGDGAASVGDQPVAGAEVHLAGGGAGAGRGAGGPELGTSDGDGQITFLAVAPGTRLVALDARTLPPGATVVAPSSIVVDLLDGERAEVEFLVTPAAPLPTSGGPFLELTVARKGSSER